MFNEKLFDFFNKLFSSEGAISRLSIIGDNSDYLAAVGGNGNRAFFVTARAGDILIFLIKRNLLFQSASLCQSACGTKSDTKSAVVAVRFIKRKLEGGGHVCLKASAQKSYGGNIHNLAAGSYAKTAENAFIRISHNEVVGILAVI